MHEQMELGGKDVCIVCEDADLDLAAKNIVKGGFSYSGQRCTAVKLVRRRDIPCHEIADMRRSCRSMQGQKPHVATLPVLPDSMLVPKALQTACLCQETFQG